MIWSRLAETNPEIIDTFNDPLSQVCAVDFVQKVMADTPLTPVDININSKKLVTAKAIVEHSATPRKRQVSGADEEKVSQSKKSKCDSDKVNHPPLCNDNKSVVNMIEKLASSLDTMTNRLERRISDIEGSIERKLTAKFNTVITDRVKSEVRQARDEMKIELDLLKD